MRTNRISFFILILFLFSHVLSVSSRSNSQQTQTTSSNVPAPQEQPLISNIVVSGNKHVTTQAILNRVPFKIGDKFDAAKSGRAIHLLAELGYFRQIQIEREDQQDATIIIYVIVEENKLIEKITFQGNKALSKSKILEKLKLDKLPTIDEEMLERIAHKIKKLYIEENHHLAKITPQLIVNKSNPDKAIGHFVINEGPKSMIKRVFFRGNFTIPDRRLRAILFTRENWLFGFLSEAGKFAEDQLEMDKHRIEYFYRDQGYLMARVVDARAQFSEKKDDIDVYFEIREGPQFIVNKVKVIGDDIFSQEELLPLVTIEEKQPFSQTRLVDSINKLKAHWGEKGYIYADVYPQVKPDENTKTVDITFHTERGNKMFVNRINVTGNHYTRDKVIRREIDFEEGDLITSSKLNISKANVEYLSYFDRGGVNWKIHRINDEMADLEMNVKEMKTGQFNFSMTYGSDKYSSVRTVKGILQGSKKNLFGRGWDVSALLQATRKAFQKFQFQFFDPYFFDTNVSAGFDAYVRREEYDQWTHVSHIPIERTKGGNIRFGFMLPAIDKRLQFLADFGAESIRNNKPIARGASAPDVQPFLNRLFQNGTWLWLQGDFVYDTRNHKIYPNQGTHLTWSTKFTIPGINDDFSLIKTELEVSWYAGIIGKDDLVLALHAKGGIVRKFGSPRIPYKELFHMGGQGTVRGFQFGALEPAYRGNPIGARNMVLFNAELIFPVLSDYSMKGHFFYDAGAGWDTQTDSTLDPQFLTRNHFNVRHSVGFGINLLYPQPIKIDWGYKLDRNKDLKEAPSEWHISMNMAW